MYFRDLETGDRFTIYTLTQVFTKIKPQHCEDGDFGGYLYTARSDNGDLHIIGQYLEVQRI